MVTLNTQSLTVPVGIIRLFEFVLTLITFSLVASVGHSSSSFWAWCMFTWCFCCFMTLLIIILELTSLNTKVPISWDDFTTAFAMLSTLMLLAASVIYPKFFVCSTCATQIAATVISCVCFVLYAAEVGLTRAKPGEISGFLSTVPGLLKVLEAFVACIIFISLESSFYRIYPGLQWCVAVYSICFIVSLLIILLTIGRLLARCPFPLDKCLTGFNILAVLMYITAVVIWPIYCFEGKPRSMFCLPNQKYCFWDSLVVVSCMTCINLIVYIVDTVYSVRLVFFVSPA
ncbi:myeloid-associated differentiation marker homolog-like [Rhinichthys klamathensis goyatoka]|uniref:myeloid-associated differentiation marker homolog-like n=1 Tax=Rhinichthys klamathensis goyatoka TaxID=3034132 RepID=UPI0024B4B5F4|nr:myeloid-associated differentiation marker homolog-like [Rhinichthys klamathensis goyatoka]